MRVDLQRARSRFRSTMRERRASLPGTRGGVHASSGRRASSLRRARLRPRRDAQGDTSSRPISSECAAACKLGMTTDEIMEMMRGRMTTTLVDSNVLIDVFDDDRGMGRLVEDQPHAGCGIGDLVINPIDLRGNLRRLSDSATELEQALGIACLSAREICLGRPLSRPARRIHAVSATAAARSATAARLLHRRACRVAGLLVC